MEEEKAAAYYDELVRKGSNAARFKQGLGFGGKVSEVSSSSIPKSDVAHASVSLSNFVKQASAGSAAAAAIQTETKVDSIRDKLKKKERIRSCDDDDDVKRKHRGRTRCASALHVRHRPRNDEKFVNGSRQESRKDAEHVSSGGGSPLRNRHEGHSNSADPPGGERLRRSKHNSPSSKRNVSHSHDLRSLSSSSSEHSSRDFGDRSRRRKHGRSPSPRHRRTLRRDSRDDRSPRQSKEQMLPGDLGDSSTCSPSRLKEKSWQRGHRDERDTSQSQSKERSQRDHRDSSSNWFKERSVRKRRRSHSLSSDSDESSFQHSPRRGRIRSSDKSWKRSRAPSHSRKRRDRSHSAERHQERSRRSSSWDRDRRRRSTSVEKRRRQRSLSLSQEREKGDGDGRSERPGRSSASRADTSSRTHGRNGDSKTKNDPKVKTRAPDRDFLKLIPNFDSMTPAEKVKAKMKLQLSETVVKDTAKGMTGEWERFDFDKDAPLDDEAKLDYFGDGTGAIDDMGHMRNTGSTLLSTANQARREAQIQAAHDAAIFGAPIANAHDTSGSKTKKGGGGSGHNRRVRDSEEDLAARKRSDVTSLSDEERSKVTTEAPPGTGVVSEQIIAMQSAGSWQERAKKMREARAAAGLQMEESAS